MKKFLFINTLIIFTGTLFFNTASAQKLLSDAALSYSISITGAKSEANPPSSLQGAELMVYLKPQMSRSDMQSGLGVESSVYDGKAGKGFILKEYSGQKLMITLDEQNWAVKNKVNNALKFTVEAGTTTIGEYQCKKATANGAEGKTYVVYYTPDITLKNKNYNGAFPQLEGLPVKYELASGTLTFTYTLKDVTTNLVQSSRFEAPQSGFRVMSYDENQQLKKGE